MRYISGTRNGHSIMDSGQSPKSNTLPVKTILLILLGAAIAIWFILQRNKPQGLPRVSSGSSIANDMSNATALPTQATSQAHQERVERYPMLDSPDSVTADQEFPIQVSLTEQQQTPDVKIMNGRRRLTASWFSHCHLRQITVGNWMSFCARPACSLLVEQPSAVSTCRVRATPRLPSSTSKPGPGAVARGVAHVLATFDYKGGYLARIGRDIQITSATPALPSEAPAMRPTVKTSGVDHG